jgi:hypothetical protein
MMRQERKLIKPTKTRELPPGQLCGEAVGNENFHRVFMHNIIESSFNAGEYQINFAGFNLIRYT